jgi:spore germination protein GerM
MTTKRWPNATSFLLALGAMLITQSVANAEWPGDSRSTAESQAASYWVLASNSSTTRLVPVSVNGAPTASSQLMLTGAFSQLLARSSSSTGSYSSIPANTRLLSLKVQSNDVYVDLSREFIGGGGSASMISRLHQVVYTATSLNPDARVFISVEGKVLDENTPIAGEGLTVRYPIDRRQLAEDFALR